MLRLDFSKPVSVESPLKPTDENPMPNILAASFVDSSEILDGSSTIVVCIVKTRSVTKPVVGTGEGRASGPVEHTEQMSLVKILITKVVSVGLMS